MSTIIHLMGPTCAGKSSIIHRLRHIAGDIVHAVEVGKMLRAKHGEAYFNGQAAPLYTQAEAWDMYVQGVEEGIKQGKRLILVDGQPRDISQCRAIISLWPRPHLTEYVLIHADHEVREARAKAGRSGPSLDLAIARLSNDYRNSYVVMTELLKQNQCIRVFDTSDAQNANGLAEFILAEYVVH